jgi:hypothetical protein
MNSKQLYDMRFMERKRNESATKHGRINELNI